MGQILYFDSQREAERYIEKLGRDEMHEAEAARKAGRSFRSSNWKLQESNDRPGKWELVIV